METVALRALGSGSTSGLATDRQLGCWPISIGARPKRVIREQVRPCEHLFDNGNRPKMRPSIVWLSCRHSTPSVVDSRRTATLA